MDRLARRFAAVYSGSGNEERFVENTAENVAEETYNPHASYHTGDHSAITSRATTGTVLGSGEKRALNMLRVEANRGGAKKTPPRKG